MQPQSTFRFKVRLLCALTSATVFLPTGCGTRSAPPAARVDANSLRTEKRQQSPMYIELATPDGIFGPYDAAMLSTIQHRWFEFTDKGLAPSANKPGPVTIDFHLHPDGHISGLQLESTPVNAAALMCQNAISESAPFERWPLDMRRAVSNESRAFSLTFHYVE